MPYSIGGGRGERAAGVPAQSGPLGDIADAAPSGAMTSTGPAPAKPAPPAEPPVVLAGPPSRRLAQLGLELPAVPAPVAAYVPAVRTGSLVFSSGQLPFVRGELLRTGAVGDQPVDVSPADATSLARTCALNALAALATVVELDSIERVVKVTGFVASAPGFGGQPAVVDGASGLLGEVFGDAGRHARSAVGVAQLPLNAPVEIEVVVEVG